MDRRGFLAALGIAAVAPAAMPRRVYSFLWDNPLVRPALPLGALVVPGHGAVYLDGTTLFYVSLIEKPLNEATRVRTIEEFRRVFGRHDEVERYLMRPEAWRVKAT